MMHDTDMVTHILKFTQIVGRYKHGHLFLCDLRQYDAPDLTPHHRVESVHRFVQNQNIRLAADGKPECHLFLHSLRQPSDIALHINIREKLLHPVKQLSIKRRIDPLIKTLHLHRVCLHEIKQFVWYVRDF